MLLPILHISTNLTKQNWFRGLLRLILCQKFPANCLVHFFVFTTATTNLSVSEFLYGHSLLLGFSNFCPFCWIFTSFDSELLVEFHPDSSQFSDPGSPLYQSNAFQTFFSFSIQFHCWASLADHENWLFFHSFSFALFKVSFWRWFPIFYIWKILVSWLAT